MFSALSPRTPSTPSHDHQSALLRSLSRTCSSHQTLSTKRTFGISKSSRLVILCWSRPTLMASHHHEFSGRRTVRMSTLQTVSPLPTTTPFAPSRSKVSTELTLVPTLCWPPTTLVSAEWTFKSRSSTFPAQFRMSTTRSSLLSDWSFLGRNHWKTETARSAVT